MIELRLKDVSKTFDGAVQALAAVDLVVSPGEFLVLVGPSGCGKSTLLRIVAGLESPTGGTVHIGGRDVTAFSPAERDIAMVFQSYALYPQMNSFDNMAYGLRNRRTPKEVVQSRIAQAANRLELEPLLGRKPKQLSGGQRQRVAMGRAIVRHPKVFLFDEPLSNLDAKLRVSMRVEIKELHRQLGITALYVTHDQVEAMTLADRLVVLNGGRVEQIGTPAELYKRPATLFVAGFLGSPAMNLLAPGDLGYAGEVGDRGSDPGAAAIGLRPENLSLAAAEGARALHGRLDLVENLGADQLLYVRLPSGVRITARASTTDWEAYPGSRDDALQLFYSPTQLHLFDCEGRRLDQRGLRVSAVDAR